MPGAEVAIDWAGFQQQIARHTRFLLTSHVRPDGDALGSELGMAGILESLGKQVQIVNPDAAPERYDFLDPQRRIRVLGRDVQADALPAFDALMVLDTSAWVQLGPMADVVRSTTAAKIVLDHHVSADDLDATVFKDPRAEATGRLVAEAAQHLGVTLTPEVATALFVAQATDTGWYRFGSTTGQSLRIAGDLVDAGAKPAEIYRQLYEQDTLARVHLIGRVLTRTTVDLEGRLVYTFVTDDDFVASGAERSDTEDIINMTMAVRGSQVAAIFVEQPDGHVKVSLRSRGDVDVSAIAEEFGGGGHKAAAGAMLDGPLDDAMRHMLDRVRAAMQ